MRQQTVANEALEAVNELQAIERVERRRPEFSWEVARPLVDATMLMVACFAAVIGSEAAGVSTPPVASLVGFAGLVLVLLTLRGVYKPRIRPELLENLRGVVASTSLAAMTVLTLRALLADSPELAAQTIRPWAFATAYLAAGRIALHWSQSQARRQGEALRPTLIVGAGRVGSLIAQRPARSARARAEAGRVPRQRPAGRAGRRAPLPVLGASWDLDEVIAPPRRRARDRHLLDGAARRAAAARAPLRGARRRGLARPAPVRVDERPRSRSSTSAACRCAGAPRRPEGLAVRGQVRARPRRRRCRAAARCSPLLAVAAAAIWISLGRPDPLPPAPRRPRRPALRHAQVPLDAASRAGDRGRSVELPPGTAPGGVEGDDRRTRVGTFLRAHLARRAAAALQRPEGRDEPRRPAARAAGVRRAVRERASTATTTATASSPASPAGRRSTACAARPRSPTASSGTTTTSRTGRSGSTSRSRS